jgi:hypothetical protein
MLGSATLTTRLSRTTMNRPIDTIAKVQALDREELDVDGMNGLLID